MERNYIAFNKFVFIFPMEMGTPEKDDQLAKLTPSLPQDRL
jgi:hypothetical protein